jgi:hypothetical protein
LAHLSDARTADARSLDHAGSGNLARVYGCACGDLVRIVRGPFEGFWGTVVGTGDDGRSLVVDVEVFGRSTHVLLAPEDVTRIDPGEGGSGVREPRVPREPSGSDAIEEVASDGSTL